MPDATSADRMSIVVSVTDIARVDRGSSNGHRPSASGSHDLAGEQWFTAMLRESRSVDAELILAGDLSDHASSLDAAARLHGVPLRIIAAHAASLTPQLWGLGLAASEREIVVFSINQCVVNDGWARSILANFAYGDAGIGGTLELSNQASLTGQAIYFLRYAAFLGTREETRRAVRDIAGDNAAYRRDVLSRYGPYDHGFWEIEAHHWLRADGGTLALVPGMEAVFGGSPRLFPFMRQRFAHGRHFGAWRAHVGGRASWKIVMAAPLVPFVFLLRTARRVMSRPGTLMRLVACAAPFLLLAAAWAAGEAVGALAPGEQRFGAPNAL